MYDGHENYHRTMEVNFNVSVMYMLCLCFVASWLLVLEFAGYCMNVFDDVCVLVCVDSLP